MNLKDNETEMLEHAHRLIQEALELRENPSKLRLILVELQALRFSLGQTLARYRCLARDESRVAYKRFKSEDYSANASYKETEMDEKVIGYKNARDFLETAYETISDFVNINQTSLKIAVEESKNNL